MGCLRAAPETAPPRGSRGRLAEEDCSASGESGAVTGRSHWKKSLALSLQIPEERGCTFALCNPLAPSMSSGNDMAFYGSCGSCMVQGQNLMAVIMQRHCRPQPPLRQLLSAASCEPYPQWQGPSPIRVSCPPPGSGRFWSILDLPPRGLPRLCSWPLSISRTSFISSSSMCRRLSSSAVGSNDVGARAPGDLQPAAWLWVASEEIAKAFSAACVASTNAPAASETDLAASFRAKHLCRWDGCRFSYVLFGF